MSSGLSLMYTAIYIAKKKKQKKTDGASAALGDRPSEEVINSSNGRTGCGKILCHRFRVPNKLRRVRFRVFERFRLHRLHTDISFSRRGGGGWVGRPGAWEGNRSGLGSRSIASTWGGAHTNIARRARGGSGGGGGGR